MLRPTKTSLFISLAFLHVLHNAQAKIVADETPKTLIEKISIAHLSSLAAQDVEEQEKKAKTQSQNAEKIAKMQFHDIQEIFGKVEQLKTAYQLHNAASYAASFHDSCDITNNTLADLSLYCGDKETPEYHVFGQIDRTTTLSGKVALQTLLAQPTYNVNKLKKRQAFLQLLINDQELYEKLKKTLQIIKNNEAAFLSIARDMQVEVEKYYRDVLFDFSFLRGLNKNAQFMHGGTYFLAGRELASFFLPQTIMIGAFAAGAGALHGRAFAWQLCRTMISYASGYEAFVNPNEQSIYCAVMTGIYLGLGLYALSNRLPVVQKLKAKMSGVADVLIKTHKDLAATLATYPQASAILPDLEENIFSHISKQESKQILQVLEKLESNWFKAGHAVEAFERKNELLKGNFGDSYKFLGQIDAYMSMATLMKEYEQNNNAQYCFVTFIKDAHHPVVDLKGFWHPMLNPDTVVTNDIHLGTGNAAYNAIITGPNAGGKSTTLRSICLAVLFGSTFGVAPAQEATMTPFHNIATYLNVADSEGKESLLQAEMRRAQTLLNSIKALRPTEFSFVVMDELLTGTNPKEAVAGIRGIAERLSSFTNSSILLTTHFVELTELEKDTKKFTNYKVAVEKENGIFKFPYKLEYGITDQAIALELLAQSGFDNKILQVAQAYMNR